MEHPVVNWSPINHHKDFPCPVNPSCSSQKIWGVVDTTPKHTINFKYFTNCNVHGDDPKMLFSLGRCLVEITCFESWREGEWKFGRKFCTSKLAALACATAVVLLVISSWSAEGRKTSRYSQREILFPSLLGHTCCEELLRAASVFMLRKTQRRSTAKEKPWYSWVVFRMKKVCCSQAQWRQSATRLCPSSLLKKSNSQRPCCRPVFRTMPGICIQ